MSRFLINIKVHLSVILFGLAGVLGKQMTNHALIIVLSRVLIASICLGIVIQFFSKAKLNATNLNLTVFASGLCLAFHWFSFFYAIQLSSVTLGLLCYACFPCFILIIESFIYKKQLNAIHIFFSLSAIAGIMVAFPFNTISGFQIHGLFWGIMSAFSFAILTLINKHIVKKQSSLAISFWQDLLASMILLPVLFFVDFRLNGNELGLMLCLGIFCTALAHWLFIESLKYKSAYELGMIACIEPIYAILIAYFWLNEDLSFNILVGGGIVIISSVFAQRKITEAS